MLDTQSVFDPNFGQQNPPFAPLTNSLSSSLDLPKLAPVLSRLSYQPQLDLQSLLQSSVSEEINSNDRVLRGSASSDFLSDGSGKDNLYGLAGDDILVGNSSDDLLNGGTGKDLLIGGRGNNTLVDDDGGDFLAGGSGSDQFWIEGWNAPELPSTIADFQVGTDKLKVRRLDTTFDKLKIQDTEQGVMISEQDRPIAVLLGVKAATLSADSFIFGKPDLAPQLQTALNNSLPESGAPGATNAIVTPDGFTWKGAAGFSDLAQQTPMQPDDIFSIASTTKAFTAATVLKVVEDGKLSLDDTLGKWLPDIAQNIPHGQGITLRQLLNGTSGIINFDETAQYQTDFFNLHDASPEKLVSYVYGQPRFVPGNRSSSQWAYTNTGDIIAGLIVEKATGAPFAVVMREEVLNPLGLKHTFFGGKEPISGNLTRSYRDFQKADGSPGLDGIPDDFTAIDVPAISRYGAAGALFSNAEDVARFSQALFGGELLSSNSINQLTSFVETGVPTLFPQYGLGVIGVPVSSLGRQWLLAGDSLASQSLTVYFPDQGETSNVVLTNRQSGFDNPPKSTAFPIQTASLTALEALSSA